MARALWNGKVIAESDVTETVEGNIYFPEASLKREFFRPSSTTSTCPWKGQARYYSLSMDGQENPDAAWYYPDPKPAARKIKGFVAFWRFSFWGWLSPSPAAPLIARLLSRLMPLLPLWLAIQPTPEVPRAG